MKLSDLYALLEEEKDAAFDIAVSSNKLATRDQMFSVLDANLRRMPDGSWLLTFEVDE